MKGYTQQVANLIMSALLLSIGAWGGTFYACTWLECYPWLKGAAAVGAILFVLVPTGLSYRARVLRLVRGRQPLRPLTEFNLMTFSREVTSIFKAPESVPMLDEIDRGWQVAFTDGESLVKVNVYKMELYRWLIDCYIEQRRQVGKGSAISQRANRNLDRLQWQARIELLKRANAVIRNSNAANSPLYLRVFENKEPLGAAWYVVDELLEEVEASKKIW